MKTYFDIHGSLVVEGEDATEWLALKTWADNWTAGTSPLWVSIKTSADRFGNGTIDLRQMFRTTKENHRGPS